MTMPDTSSYFGKAMSSDEDRPSAPWIKFYEVGDEVDMTVLDKGMAPDYEYNPAPNAPKVQKTWPNGDPKEFLRVSGTLNKPARVGDGVPNSPGKTIEAGEEVNLAVKGKRMTGAIGGAVREAGANDVNPGGRLWVKFTGKVVASLGMANDFTAKYKVGEPPAADTSSYLNGSANGGGLSAPAGKAPQDDAPPFHNGFLNMRPGHDEVVA